jgi:hypothetical protein
VSGGIVYPQVAADEWALRYQLAATVLCPKCGKDVPLTKPFAFKGWRGISSEDHGCGPNHQPSCARPIGETGRQWKEMMESLWQELRE